MLLHSKSIKFLIGEYFLTLKKQYQNKLRHFFPSIARSQKLKQQQVRKIQSMRNRTEMVSNTGSDYDENEGEFEADDGSDDWKPDPEVGVGKIGENLVG